MLPYSCHRALAELLFMYSPSFAMSMVARGGSAISAHIPSPNVDLAIHMHPNLQNEHWSDFSSIFLGATPCEHIHGLAALGSGKFEAKPHVAYEIQSQRPQLRQLAADKQ